jgi:hypothetical protein
MRLEVLYVPDCPNLEVMLDRLAQVTDLPVVTRVIESEEDAVRFGMTGSPTLLVDGVDPFATAGEGSLSCRFYRDQDGRIVPAPSVEQLCEAVNRRSTPTDVLSAWRTRARPLLLRLRELLRRPLDGRCLDIRTFQSSRPDHQPARG